MRTRLIILTILSAISFLHTSCDKDLEKNNNIRENFDVLWKTIDEKYCFFEYKKDSIKDWKVVKQEYLPKLNDCETMQDMFDVFAAMLGELKDAHVNLYSSFDVSRYDYDKNDDYGYDPVLLSESEKYLGGDYRVAGGMVYKLMRDSLIGYIRYGSFSSSVSETNLDNIITAFKNTKGVVIDIRGNGGGLIDMVNRIAGRFTKEEVLVGYRQYKTGPKHNDLSKPVPEKLSPTLDHTLYLRPVIVLTNRACYSAANQFVQTMKCLPNVIIMGYKTGGGSGVPFSAELPCGWNFRFSANPYMDVNKKYTEFGVEPDVYLKFNRDLAYLKGDDNLIETACDIIIKFTSK